ncbi:hypothetical protein J421_1471 [Gemmatirosa kalamazoonensis]|jgi:hypothetical protein|uniref:Uncharacterized protein n=1 Tax=Gemmatirosa kalamazoonensis TaxID=861299 RepID=W0RHW9_9BACT|nr:hypothetical protein [Gemmatirosa kalamazoonensis]AHG89008.1 hypothetical protein J421_1471 [Gemmatirosa kalamazoonensis]
MLDAHFTAAPEAPRTRHGLGEQIRHRSPRPGAVAHIAVSSPPSRLRFLDYTRLSGPRDDVLDYAAFLFATDTGWGDTALELVSVEEEDGENLTVLLAKPL